MNRLEHKIPPPVVFLAVAIAMWGLAHALPRIAVADPLRYGLASVLFVAAGFFGAPAIAAFRRARTTIDPVRIEGASSLVTGGIYRRSRNPMYVGLALLLTCCAVWLAVPWLLLGPAAFVAYVTRFQILPEERALQAKFGEDYARYRSTVRRWL